MLYTPVPGTPLYAEMKQQDRLLDVNLADIHGQDKFNFAHAAISRDQSSDFLEAAFVRDFERNGPSLFRICRTTMAGWMRYKNDPDARIRRRFQWEVRSLKSAYSALLWAMERQLKRTDPSMSLQVHTLRKEVGREFGLGSKLTAALLGPIMLLTSHREQKQLAAGKTYEPATFIERRNWDAKPALQPAAPEVFPMYEPTAQ